MANIAGMFQGLNQAISGFGGRQQQQQVPQDPLQQNLMQRAGITNPMLQMFGQGLAGVTGTDTRSEMDIFKDTLKGVDVTTPEGRTAYLQALSRIKPEAAVQEALKFKEADEQSKLRAAQIRKYDADREAGRIKTGSRVQTVPMLDKYGYPVVGKDGKTIYTEKTVQYTMRKLEDGEWYEVEADENGKLVPVHRLSQEEVKNEALPTETGTVIRVGDKLVPVIDKGDWYEDANGVRYSKESFDALKQQETTTPPQGQPVPPPSQGRGQPAAVDPIVRAKGTGGRSGNVSNTGGMFTESRGYTPRTRSGR